MVNPMVNPYISFMETSIFSHGFPKIFPFFPMDFPWWIPCLNKGNENPSLRGLRHSPTTVTTTVKTTSAGSATPATGRRRRPQM